MYHVEGTDDRTINTQLEICKQWIGFSIRVENKRVYCIPPLFTVYNVESASITKP